MKNVRAGIMPPPKKPQPSAAQKQQLEQWIKSAVFASDPMNPDPGRVTVRRLNRVEYRNTIRDLLGLDFETEKVFPPDDSGHGFDNIGDVLTLPPMLLEKYLAAAKTVITRSVPSVPGVPAENAIPGREFSGVERAASGRENRTGSAASSLTLSYYEQAAVSNTFKADHAGSYRLHFDLSANERFVDNQFDYNKCRLEFKVDGVTLHSEEYTREGGKALHYEFDLAWEAGNHELTVELHPLTPDEKQVRSLTMRIDSVTVVGPLDPKHWVRPRNYERFYTRTAPEDGPGRRAYARELLEPIWDVDSMFRDVTRTADALLFTLYSENERYTIETSTNLIHWESWRVIDNDTEVFELSYPFTNAAPQLFFRARKHPDD